MSEWQPIETAPKDGKQILAAHKSGSFYTIRWDFELEEWVIVSGSMTRQCTHWMPLPDPPQGAAE